MTRNNETVPSPAGEPTDTLQVLRHLADTVSLLIWMTDANGNCIYLNQSASELFDQLGQVNIASWAQFIHPEDVARTAAIMDNARELHQEYQVEYRIIRSDGSIRWMLGSGAPRYSPQGEFQGFTGAILDVSERHEMLDRLARSEAAYRLLTEYSSDLISHHSPGGAYVYASPSFRRVLGYDPSELIGVSVYERMHPDDVQLILDEVRRQTEDGGDDKLVEIRLRHKDGHYVWIGTKAKIMTDPVTHAYIGTVAISRDITAERLARDELRKQEEQFRSLTKLSSDWYWEIDEEGRFTYMSDGVDEALAVGPSSFLGKTRDDLSAQQGQAGLAKYADCIARRQPFKNLQYASYMPGTGLRGYVSISGEPLFENGIFRGFRGVGRNITSEIKNSQCLARLAAENKALVENSVDLIMLLDQNGRILRTNRAATDILGYLPDALCGKLYSEFVMQEDLGGTLQTFKEIQARTTTIRDYENRWVRQDGSIVYLSWNVRWSDDGNLIYATARDVTERREARTALQRSNEQLTTVLESIGDGFFSVDRHWRITYANQLSAVFVRRTREEIVGKKIWDAVPEVYNSPIFSYYQRAMETGEQEFFEEFFEPGQAWINVRVYPHEEGLSVFFHDITAKREAANAVLLSEQRLRDMVEMTPAGYFVVEKDGRLAEVNPSLCVMCGYEENELIGKHILELFPVSPFGPGPSDPVGDSTIHGVESVIRHKQGRLLYVLINANMERNEKGEPMLITAFMTDITARKQAELRLRKQATHDALTGLPNRVYLDERLPEILGYASRGQVNAVMFIDLDRFKEVNDKMGHAAGDALLREVARRLRQQARHNDIVARLGGDEFIVIAPCSDGERSAMTIAEKILSSLAAPANIDGSDVVVGGSIGISMFPQDGTTKEELFQHADDAMYRAKVAGRNGYRFYTDKIDAAIRKDDIATCLREAVERKQLELHYQARIDLDSEVVVGMEALLRWSHPQLGRVPPLQFIPVAQDAGLMSRIGQWVLETACRETVGLSRRTGRPLKVSVNLWPSQLRDAGLPDIVAAALHQSGLAPHLLELELAGGDMTDTTFGVDAHILGQLKALGVRLSVDDMKVDTGVLEHLHHLRIDNIKLDAACTSANDHANSAFRTVRMVVAAAHAMQMSVVAKRVETSKVLEFMQLAACDEGQGYLFSPPVPLEEFATLLQQQGWGWTGAG